MSETAAPKLKAFIEKQIDLLNELEKYLLVVSVDLPSNVNLKTDIVRQVRENLQLVYTIL